jgi:hypothetical protein
MADKNLRLDSRFSMIGAFWLPETPDTILKGTLVSDEREINFITAPEYESSISMGLGMFSTPDPTMIPALHGFTEDGIFTLCQIAEQSGLGSTNFAVGQAIKARSFRVLSCLGGMHINGINDKCLTSAKYTFEGLSAWFPKAFDEKWGTDQIVVTIPMEPLQIQDFCLLDSRVRISVKIVSELTSGKKDPSRLSRSIASIEVESPNPESLAWYRRLGGRLENLFSLLTGGSVAMDTLFVYHGDESGHLITKRAGSVRHFERLQCVMCTPNQLAQAIVTWMCLPPKFDSVESLALEVLRKSKLFIETEFLALSQALEGFHRATTDISVTDRLTLRKVRKAIRLTLDAQAIDAELREKICNSMMHAGDPTLATRLTALCQSIGAPTLTQMGIVPETFISNVVVTRNFYTHAGSGQKHRKKPAQGKEMFLLNQKMRALLRGAMLLHLRLPENQIADVLAREATKWQ